MHGNVKSRFMPILLSHETFKNRLECVRWTLKIASYLLGRKKIVIHKAVYNAYRISIQ